MNCQVIFCESEGSTFEDFKNTTRAVSVLCEYHRSLLVWALGREFKPMEAEMGKEGGNDVRREGTTAAEAGRKGGLACKAKYGNGYFAVIGARGGDKIKALGKEHFAKMGRLGGNKVKALGKEHFARIGKLGGDKVAATHGPEFYEEIGRKGGARIKELIAAGRVEAAKAGALETTDSEVKVAALDFVALGKKGGAKTKALAAAGKAAEAAKTEVKAEIALDEPRSKTVWELVGK